MEEKEKNSYRRETQLVHLGNTPSQQYGYVSPPIFRGSTAIYENTEGMKSVVRDPLKTQFPSYGRFGSPNARALEEALTSLEGGHNTVLTGAGLSAITTAILAFVASGDHILVADSVYWPTRDFCDSLARFGITTEYYDPRIGSDIEKLIRPNTKLVYLESPGSMTFELQDIPAITSVCKKHSIITMTDNTWATPLFCQPLRLGVDLSIHSGTKYLGGHSDSFLGAIICNEATYLPVRTQALQLGQFASAEDLFLCLRGLRTLSVRLQQHQAQALAIAEWLQEQPEVSEVLYPALPSSPDYAIWKRDFSGASGLLGFMVDSQHQPQSVETMINSLKLFGLGHSWGGFESLVATSDPSSFRLKSSWKLKGTLVRLHVGVEDLEDLKKDLRQGFQHLSN